ncbi:MAG TPA: transglutaminase family protein [Candidatus Dormibacteraeota bacterium]|jgi:transglutaminase-like putative cysteine protease|nr:transglutaminase family protein [Candidatus Dormibacteraeota bacterium]
MRLEIVHETRYRYPGMVREAHMALRMRPLDGAGQRVLHHQVELGPKTHVRRFVDGFGNHVHTFDQLTAHDHLDVISRATVETGVAGRPRLNPVWPADLLLFRSPVVETARVRRLARDVTAAAGTVEEAVLQRLTDAIAARLTYRQDSTTISTDADEVLRHGYGVCQDFAHVFIAAARFLGVPARYVSGYVHTGGEAPVEGASHAWAEAMVPGAGWTPFDPTHPSLAHDHYVRVATGRDYQDAAPTRGVYIGPPGSDLRVSVVTTALPTPV